MKTESLLLLGVAGFVLYEWMQGTAMGSTGTPYRYPPSPTGTGTKPSGGGVSVGGGGGGIPGGGGGGGTGPSGSFPPNQSVTGYICDDGTEVNDPSLCTGSVSGIICDDGTEVNDPSLCPQPPIQYYQCMDGSYTDDLSTCPENQPQQPVDTMDPCDPNSSMYDPTQCGAPGGTVYDSMDPCDPASVAYDPNTCYGTGYL
jgi:hypothetical protein